MKSPKNAGRLVGLLYLLVSIPGFFALIYVPHKLIVRGDATATATNIAAHETLFRVGLTCDVLGEILFLWVALALYDLFKNVSRRQSALMFGLLAISVPITLLNDLNSIAALTLIRGADFLSIYDKPHRDALAMLFLTLHSRAIDIIEIFWGLWLFPLGLLVYRSRFLPRILGILLMLNCFTYVADSILSLLAPLHANTVAQWMKPFSFGELIFMLWLLILGADPKSPSPQASST